MILVNIILIIFQNMKTMLAQDMKILTNFYTLLTFLKFLCLLVSYKREAFPDI